MENVEVVDKETIPNYHFVSYEVLDTKEQILQRKTDLERAMLIGNSDKGKAKILFLAEQGYKVVETTVWATTDETVTLKGGINIPIHCIRKVTFA